MKDKLITLAVIIVMMALMVISRVLIYNLAEDHFREKSITNNEMIPLATFNPRAPAPSTLFSNNNDSIKYVVYMSAADTANQYYAVFRSVPPQISVIVAK